MSKKWTLHIENFAKIKETDIEISPFICFVGDNNTGKSYLMSLLWGVLTFGKDVFPVKTSESQTYKQCEEWLKSKINSTVCLNDDIIQMYINWYNELLNTNKKALAKKIFNYDVHIGKLEIKNYVIDTDLTIQWGSEFERYSVTKTLIKIPVQENYTREDYMRMNAYICWNILMNGISSPLYNSMIKGRRNGEPIYFPASRTGFMLTYLQLLDNSIQTSFSKSDNENSSSLTAPYVDFLRLITHFEISEKIKYKNVVNYIEKEMIKGAVKVEKTYVPVIKYKPDGSAKDLPLYISSSVVAEISPILLTLKSNINFKALIIEEPEAHLHPELQLKIARVIIQLMNSGVPVWITTHSDTILQHINNMIKLKNHRHSSTLMSEYGYSKDDLVDSNDVKIYQFDKANNNETKLIELEQNNFGFVVPTFNNAIKSLVNEVYAFEEGEDV